MEITQANLEEILYKKVILTEKSPYSFLNGICGVLIKTPEYDYFSKPRAEFAILHIRDKLIMYVNLYPEKILNIVKEKNRYNLYLSNDHSGGGGHYQNKEEAYKLLGLE